MAVVITWGSTEPSIDGSWVAANPTSTGDHTETGDYTNSTSHINYYYARISGTRNFAIKAVVRGKSNISQSWIVGNPQVRVSGGTWVENGNVGHTSTNKSWHDVGIRYATVVGATPGQQFDCGMKNSHGDPQYTTITSPITAPNMTVYVESGWIESNAVHIYAENMWCEAAAAWVHDGTDWREA